MLVLMIQLIERSLLAMDVDRSSQVTMEPCPILHCSPESVEERGRSSNVETSGASSAEVHCEITTILSGESAFLYGNIATENPKNPSPSSPSVSGYDWASRDTQDPFKFTSWSEDKMTIDEFDALNMLTALSRPFSSRKIINCLEHDDFDSRVFDIMGRKGHARDWFRIMTESKSGNIRDAQRAAEGVSREKDTTSMQTDRVAHPEVTVVEDRPFVRKRKGRQAVEKPTSSKKMKESEELVDRPIPDDKEIMEEMGKAIVLEHTQGFNKALRQASHLLNISTEGVDFDPRKDVYQGRLISLSEIPEGALLVYDPAKENAATDTPITGEVMEEDVVASSTNVADVVHVE
ncbi:hypothetical protein LR48_Vigan04g122500 [Vigna angularis]|uniref:Uncharacterized protein n=1 Tax=Phaseolus angularis TaxID=3914 RepID=A0A0L9UER4_PHAAN|nr:hypothetical protein LR48_Vigan04g122500 [Vigna angularis]